jgi:hypothetical protein
LGAIVRLDTYNKKKNKAEKTMFSELLKYFISILQFLNNVIKTKVLLPAFEPSSWRGVLDTTLCDKVCQ